MNTLREIIEEKKAEVQRSGNPSRSHTTIIGGEQKNLTVISLPLELPILNDKNHRIAAQIEDGNLLNRLNPYEVKAQKIIENLLIETDEFGTLKQELKALGQREPGLITIDGFLVNGNTRCAALRELQKEGGCSHIDVAILPNSVSSKEVMDIEIDLQMVKLTHQSYTYTNNLKLVHEALNQKHYGEKELAKKMNKRPKTIHQMMRIYKILAEIREMKDPPIPWSAFDQKETSLKDLDEKMQSLENEGNKLGAENVKYARILSIFLGLNKDHVREVDEDTFHDIANTLPETDGLREYIDNSLMSNDSDFGDEETDQQVNCGKVLRNFLSIPEVLDENQIVNTDKIDTHFKKLGENLHSHTEQLVVQGRQQSRSEKLITTLRGIRINVSTIRLNLAERMEHETFKPGDFQFEIRHAKKELDDLMSEYNKLRGR